MVSLRVVGGTLSRISFDNNQAVSVTYQGIKDQYNQYKVDWLSIRVYFTMKKKNVSFPRQPISYLRVVSLIISNFNVAVVLSIAFRRFELMHFSRTPSQLSAYRVSFINVVETF